MLRETVKLKHLHITPDKARLVANLIKRMPANEAEAQLMILSKRAAEPILKLLKSAVANMVNNRKADSEKLVIESITVDEGPTFKRFLPRSMGRATPLLKRTSHITIVLKEVDKKKTSKFNTANPKKAKDAKKIAKEAKQSKQENKDKEIKDVSASAENKPGFVKKMFRRKSV